MLLNDISINLHTPENAPVKKTIDDLLVTFDLEDVYKKEVADYMISEYRKGRTPNPDVMCNKYVKFGAFLKKSLSMGADYVATGHYAKTSQLQEKGVFCEW